MSLRRGMCVLDVGCGVGGPAREIARFSDVKIVGLNNNEFQLGRAHRYTKAAGLEDQIQFIKGDFMKLSEQFGKNVFDAGASSPIPSHMIHGIEYVNFCRYTVYAIEATVYAPTWEGVYGEILKVLKPGGVVSSALWHATERQCLPLYQFGVYEWCMTDRWDPSIPDHKSLAHEIELGSGIPEMRPLSKAREALKTVGFHIENEEDLAERPDAVPWYYPLEGDIFKAQTTWDYFTVWRMSWSGQLVTHNALGLLEFLRVVPKGTWEVGEKLRIAGDALVKGGQKKVGRPLRSLNIFLTECITHYAAFYANVPGHRAEAIGPRA